jgi:hypothetical protein
VQRTVVRLGLTLLGLLVLAAWPRVAAAQLDATDFVQLARQGFLNAVDGPHSEGSQRNSYIWSMQWWHDKLYVGTLRDAICLFSAQAGMLLAPGYAAVCPPPGTLLTPNQRAEIWEYTPAGSLGDEGTWRRVFQSPLLLGPLEEILDSTQLLNLFQLLNAGQFPNVAQLVNWPGLLQGTLSQLPDMLQFLNVLQLLNQSQPPSAEQLLNLLNLVVQTPREFGYRNMTTCDAGGEEHLYVTTTGIGGRVLYSPDGSTFKTASLFGLDLIRDLGYRAMVCWKGRLWIAPSGTFTITAVTPTLAFEVDPDIAFNKVLLVNDKPSDPLSPWQRVVNVANDPGLGDPNNLGIWQMGLFNDALYLGVTNRTTGFEIWKADGATCAPPPGDCMLFWEKLIDNGGGLPVPAGATPSNARVFQFEEFNGFLYWSVGEIAAPPFFPAEMGRLGPDDRWDLIVGAPRTAATITAADPNFNCLLDTTGTVCYPLSGFGPSFGPNLTRGTGWYIWRLLSHEGMLYVGTLEGQGFDPAMFPQGVVPGFDLWRTSNGTTDWTLISNDGFGNPFNYGVRNMASTPLGLFLGTANPYTIETGANGGTGGAEVWLGLSPPQ